MSPIVQYCVGIDFVGRFFARPKPTPEPKTWHTATRAGREKIRRKVTVLPKLQHSILSVLKYLIKL
jgi:hypothetical protein